MNATFDNQIVKIIESKIIAYSDTIDVTTELEYFTQDQITKPMRQDQCYVNSSIYLINNNCQENIDL